MKIRREQTTPGDVTLISESVKDIFILGRLSVKIKSSQLEPSPPTAPKELTVDVLELAEAAAA
jgi:hypothetical protein